MELRDFLHVLRVHWVAIVLLAVLGPTVALGLASTQPPQYHATSTVLVSTRFGDSISDLNQGSSFAERQASTYAEVAKSPLVLGPVIKDLGLTMTPSALKGRVSAVVQGTTALIDIGVTDTSGERAARLTDAISAQLRVEVERLSPPRADGQASVIVTVVSPATIPARPFAPNLGNVAGMGGLVGLVLALGWALMRTNLDTKIRGEADVRRLTDVSLLGTITFDPATTGKDRLVVAAPLTRRAEEYRQLRTNLQYIDAAHRPRSIVVTSSRGGEGKSLTTINLAYALADSGVRVCLVDADLRRPSLAGYLGLEGAAGLTTVLIGRASLDDVTQTTGPAGLHVLTAGQVPPNPSELMSSQRMADVLEELKSLYDMVLFDSPPLLPVTDAAVLGALCEGVLLVTGGGIVTRDQLRDSIEMLQKVGARLFGLVLNRGPRKGDGTRTYSYHPVAVELDESATRSSDSRAKNRTQPPSSSTTASPSNIAADARK